MRKIVLKSVLLAAAVLSLAACGFMQFQRREPWRSRAEATCLERKLVVESEFMTLDRPINKGACGMDSPFKVTAFAGGAVQVKTKQTLACPIIPAIEAWIAEVVQPAAELYFGSQVVGIHAGSYSCRGRNNVRGAKLSEHSFGNALDVLTFTLADETVISVEKGWGGTEAESGFLREVFIGGCAYFTTALGPGSDKYHYNHFHLDLARHDKDWKNHYCRPILKFVPRLTYQRPNPYRK
ncbi:MAG: extensin family protein [Methylobacteriaceae bacterium]|nr:extensin family protein [Methylobacteriaceae bacterium]